MTDSSDSSDNDVIYRKLDADAESPGIEVAKAVADIDGKEVTELTTMHDCVDGVLDNLFSHPPSPEAQMRVTFNYEDYRVGVKQDGSVTLVRDE